MGLCGISALLPHPNLIPRATGRATPQDDVGAARLTVEALTSLLMLTLAPSMANRQ